MFTNALALLAALPLTSAHFTLTWPTNRGFDDTKAGTFPCGGFDSVKEPRTDFPLSGGPIQLNMEHTQTNLAVYLAIGDNPGSNYSIKLVPQLAQEGPGDFCLGSVGLPAGLNVSDGTKATIQVVSNGDPDGGLYQCADVTLTNTPLSESDYSDHCKNGTGVKVTQENMPGNPNGTSSDDSSTPTASGAGSSASPTGAAAHPTAISWILGAAGLAGMALL